MPWDLIIFYMVATICVLCAVGVVASNNPVHAAIFLVLSFFNVAAIFVMLGAEFLAVVQVIVYTGAILVLMLFVLMLVDPDDLPEFHAARPVQRYVGVLLGAILLLEVGVAIIDRTVTGIPGTASREAVDVVGGNTQALGRTLYTEYLLPFEIVSLVLTVGVIGAIVLAMPERLGERIANRRGTISLGHPRGTDFALPVGPLEESPIPGSARDEAVMAGPQEFGRELVMVRDAEEQPVVDLRR
ncbi:MAG: NADH-quinone oxidoreductase subunit [Thermomicrobiales bacterium]|jgi:NADH-quinone oxidoreductase subunit J|nr:NADH-quinone oxidoreductase subunit [Thermomicrobiales bacterium]MEA2583012.1 NADH-quinone oxidoreductase subunit [Thermomicrobiales bacterium]